MFFSEMFGKALHSDKLRCLLIQVDVDDGLSMPTRHSHTFVERNVSIRSDVLL